MSGVVVEVILLFLLILLNGLLAMSELAVVSSRKARLQPLADDGNKRAQTVIELAEKPDNFLSTVQIGITLVGVLAGAFGGQTVASALADAFREVSALAPYADTLGLGLVVLIITYCSLVLGELVPKRLALQNPEAAAMLVAPLMRNLSRAAFVVVRFLAASTNTVVRLLGVRPSNEPPVTQDEIRMMIDQGTQAGVFDSSEQDMIESVLELDDRNVNALMTPYTELVWLDVDDPLEENIAKLQTHRFASYPVCSGGLDHLLGVVRSKDLLSRVLNGEALDLGVTARQPVFVPENTPAARLVTIFQQAHEDTLLVIDEHGGIQGIVTQHDMLEGIVGNIPSPREESGRGIMQRDDGSWLVDGLAPIEDVKERLAIRDPLPDEENGSYATLGGFVMNQLGDIPREGASFAWEGWQFEVIDMDGMRVDKVLIYRQPESAEA